VKAKAMTNIVISFGYGGFIHHFKNYILRHNSEYENLTQQSLDKTYSAIASYLALNIEEVDRINILQFQQTVNHYAEQFQLAKELIHRQFDIAQIDQQVKVDDTKALTALNELLTSITYSAHETQQATGKLIETSRLHARLGFTFIAVILITSTILIAYGVVVLTRELKEKQAVFRMAPNAILVVDEAGEIINLNRKAREVFNIPEKLNRPLIIEELVPESYRQQHILKREAFIQSDREIAMELRPSTLQACKLTGEHFPVDISISAYQTANGRESIAVIRDLSDITALKKEAVTDPLTQLVNRKGGDAALISALAMADRYQTTTSVLMIDIDFFKRVNDTNGHKDGDLVLQTVSQLLVSHIRASDTLCRWGGEEFLVIAPNIALHDALAMAEVIRRRVEIEYQAHQPPITVSIGVTEYKHHLDTVESIVVRADEAMYLSKKQGRNRVSSS
jgi:diguanylate cyclase (GGDEF)-like protein/PAS domain S-box-containing protein